MNMTIIALTLALSLWSLPLYAQTGTVVDYRLDVFDMTTDPNATGAPIKTGTISASTVLCNQVVPPPPPGLTIPNPHRVYWTDGVNVGKVCIANTSIVLWFDTALPLHSYTVTITPIDDRGLMGPRSAPSLAPFEIRPPAAVLGVKLAQ